MRALVPGSVMAILDASHTSNIEADAAFKKTLEAFLQMHIHIAPF